MTDTPRPDDDPLFRAFVEDDVIRVPDMTDTPKEVEMDYAKALTFRYTNWRGETAVRTATPKRIWWGSTDWHPEPGWLMTAHDHEKDAERDFAVADCDFSCAGRVAELEAAIDAQEIEAGYSEAGSLWRFWSDKARLHVQKTKDANARADAAEAQLREARGLLREVRDCCLIGDDEGITVTEDPHLHADLFDRINDVVRSQPTPPDGDGVGADTSKVCRKCGGSGKEYDTGTFGYMHVRKCPYCLEDPRHG